MKQAKVKIRGEGWVVRVKKLKPDLYGECDYNTRTITVNTCTNPKMRRRTLIHEALHASFPDIDEAAIRDAEEAIDNAVRVGMALLELND